MVYVSVGHMGEVERLFCGTANSIGLNEAPRGEPRGRGIGIG